jgi:2-phosphoglycerate kinase
MTITSETTANNENRSWQVLLLGGASGVGKTSVSYRLARHFGVGLTEVDDFQVILEKLTTPEQLPLLHFWRTHPAEFNQLTEQARLDHFMRVCREVFGPALEAVIANHLETSTPVVLEGDFILPALAALPRYEEIAANGRVKALFIYEEDEGRIVRNFGRREGSEQQGRARSSWLFSEWLRQECARLNVPAIPARPWDTVFERALAAIQGI